MSLRISAGLSHRLKPALRAARAVEKLQRVFWCSSPLQWGYVSGTVGLYRRADGAVYAIFALQAILMARMGDRYMVVAHNPIVKKAISKEKLTKRGLVSLSDYYQKVTLS